MRDRSNVLPPMKITIFAGSYGSVGKTMPDTVLAYANQTLALLWCSGDCDTLDISSVFHIIDSLKCSSKGDRKTPFTMNDQRTPSVEHTNVKKSPPDESYPRVGGHLRSGPLEERLEATHWHPVCLWRN